MENTYDLIVIGAGPGGYSAADAACTRSWLTASSATSTSAPEDPPLDPLDPLDSPR